MKKVVNIYLPLYNVSVIIFVGTTVEYIKKYLTKRMDDASSLTPEWENCLKKGIESDSTGYTMEASLGGSDVLIYLRKIPHTNREHGVLYHEMIHAVDHLANVLDRGCKLYDEHGHSEARAYLYSHLIVKAQQEFWKPLPTKKKKK